MVSPRTSTLALGLTAAGLALVPTAFGQKPPKPPKPAPGTSAISIDVKPNPVVFGSATTLSGRFTTSGAAGGVPVKIEVDDTLPLGDSFKPTTLAATTASNGTYSVNVKPSVNSQFRAVAQSSPKVTSGARRVSVRIRVGSSVSTSTPRRGSSVRFFGSVLPAHDGRAALIQKRSSTGRFVTVARATLVDAGTARSTYSKRVRVTSDGVYRVKVSGDADHVNGFSRLRSIDAR